MALLPFLGYQQAIAQSQSIPILKLFLLDPATLEVKAIGAVQILDVDRLALALQAGVLGTGQPVLFRRYPGASLAAANGDLVNHLGHVHFLNDPAFVFQTDIHAFPPSQSAWLAAMLGVR